MTIESFQDTVQDLRNELFESQRKVDWERHDFGMDSDIDTFSF